MFNLADSIMSVSTLLNLADLWLSHVRLMTLFEIILKYILIQYISVRMLHSNFLPILTHTVIQQLEHFENTSRLRTLWDFVTLAERISLILWTVKYIN